MEVVRPPSRRATPRRRSMQSPQEQPPPPPPPDTSVEGNDTSRSGSGGGGGGLVAERWAGVRVEGSRAARAAFAAYEALRENEERSGPLSALWVLEGELAFVAVQLRHQGLAFHHTPIHVHFSSSASARLHRARRMPTCADHLERDFMLATAAWHADLLSCESTAACQELDALVRRSIYLPPHHHHRRWPAESPARTAYVLPTMHSDAAAELGTRLPARDCSLLLHGARPSLAHLGPFRLRLGLTSACAGRATIMEARIPFRVHELVHWGPLGTKYGHVAWSWRPGTAGPRGG
eukprot:scaffold32_cov368-Prasinococcus_capsulatus_cf.AAC.7